MAIRNEGQLMEGGMVSIQFPHMKVDMSCDNETELAACIDMMKKCLEVYETQRAKMALVKSIEQDKQSEEATINTEALKDVLKKSMEDFRMQNPLHFPTVGCSTPVEHIDDAVVLHNAVMTGTVA